MYIGIGHFVNILVEVQESNVQTALCRTTSSEFARYTTNAYLVTSNATFSFNAKARDYIPPSAATATATARSFLGQQTDTTSISRLPPTNVSNPSLADQSDFVSSVGSLVLPRDIVRFQYNKPIYVYYKEPTKKTYIGRIVGIGLDKRSNKERFYNLPIGSVVAKIERLIIGGVVLQSIIGGIAIEANKMFLIDREPEYVRPNRLLLYAGIVFYYEFQSRTNNSYMPARPSLVLGKQKYFVRRILKLSTTNASNIRILSLRPIQQRHLIRGELEILYFSRSNIVAKFDTMSTSTKVVSLPFFNFNDGFGLYRNIRKSLIGMYLINTALKYRERYRRSNIIPLILGLYRSNIADIVATIGLALYNLDASKMIDLFLPDSTSEQVIVVSFILAFLSNMPQQQENSSIKSQNTTYGCRSYIVANVYRGNLVYNLVANSRFYYKQQRYRRYLNSNPPNLRTKAAKDRKEKATSVDRKSPLLVLITLALDIILTRPADPYYSKQKGLTFLIYKTLITDILTTLLRTEYNAVLQVFQGPLGSRPLQSPMYYLVSYTLSQNAQQSLIALILLRSQLKDEHIKLYFLIVARAVIGGIFEYIAIQASIPIGQVLVSTIVVRTFANIARSNVLLIS